MVEDLRTEMRGAREVIAEIEAEQDEVNARYGDLVEERRGSEDLDRLGVLEGKIRNTLVLRERLRDSMTQAQERLRSLRREYRPVNQQYTDHAIEVSRHYRNGREE
ncbi:hypothetical protein OPT61_g8620 [Boeremia exigua]|uniref:Uncharacterized protein n=1 Tax=Boeremia exigua TaxID=749465 RepID=A0ACC2HXJ4_9PLEO|nr:hypothetical protein OPT61_g8620 [Boeremia exigua]